MIENIKNFNLFTPIENKPNKSVNESDLEVFNQPISNTYMTDVFENKSQYPDEPELPPQKDPNPVPENLKSKPEKPKPILGKKFSAEFKMTYPEKANSTEIEEASGYTITYNAEGKIVKLESPDGTFVREIEEETFTDRRINKDENYFNEYTFKKNNQKLLTNRRYYTDNEGKITKRIDFFKDGTACDFNQFIYDENGMLIKKESFYYISGKKSYSEFEHYSDRNYITLFTPLDINNNNYITKETVYTDDGEYIIDEKNYETNSITDANYCRLGYNEKTSSKFLLKLIHSLNKIKL